MNTAKLAIAALAAALFVTALSIGPASGQTLNAAGPAVTPLADGQIDSIPQPIQSEGSLNMIPEPTTAVGFAMAISMLGYYLRPWKKQPRRP